MYLYEVTDTTNVKKQRKYLVVAADSVKAQSLVVKLHSKVEKTSVRPANEEGARDREIPRGPLTNYSWVKTTAWDVYKNHKQQGKEKIIADYLF